MQQEFEPVTIFVGIVHMADHSWGTLWWGNLKGRTDGIVEGTYLIIKMVVEFVSKYYGVAVHVLTLGRSMR